MKRLIIILALLCNCRINEPIPIKAEPVPVETVDMELGIKRAAIFILIMRGEPVGDKELAAEIEYLKYWISKQ